VLPRWFAQVRSWPAEAEPGFWDAVGDPGETFFNETHFLLIDRPGASIDGLEMPPNTQFVADALKARGSRQTPDTGPRASPPRPLPLALAQRQCLRAGPPDIPRHFPDISESGPAGARLDDDRDRALLDGGPQAGDAARRRGERTTPRAASASAGRVPPSCAAVVRLPLPLIMSESRDAATAVAAPSPPSHQRRRSHPRTATTATTRCALGCATPSRAASARGTTRRRAGSLASLLGSHTCLLYRYDEAEGLVPPSVLGHIVRYGLYAHGHGAEGVDDEAT